jgi:hypothetical protein
MENGENHKTSNIQHRTPNIQWETDGKWFDAGARRTAREARAIPGVGAKKAVQGADSGKISRES